MYTTLSLEGEWKLQLDSCRQGLALPYQDTVCLPNTTSNARKGEPNTEALTGSLTDEYSFEGDAWFSREMDIPEHLAGKVCFLVLERTRVTTVWVNGQELGTRNSLNTPHRYELTGCLIPGRNTVTIRVSNTDYPTKGGHLTSPDTQTNWNGITGRIELEFYNDCRLGGIQVYPDVANRSFLITAKLEGGASGSITVKAESFNSEEKHSVGEQTFRCSSKDIAIRYDLGEKALLWSGSQPSLYTLTVCLRSGDGQVLDTHQLTVGLREFKANGDKFTINGVQTFLRGKHDGLIFPLTGFAPTTVEEWLRVLRISKDYGINHYRFHTCCPPEAAFTAADMLGIYMEPELPFWGTVTDETYENHNQLEQDYLLSEGFAILDAFGNHPSFVMMSLGNELWGSHSRLNDILKAYKAYDNRHLYTQGSNNFQFTPVILEEEDFFCGVRFSKDRLFRGSYAMCDAPQGHVQTDYPGTMKDYDQQIVPSPQDRRESVMPGIGGTILIQYGTEARAVEAGVEGEECVPQIPVISHEIGQYATYPDYGEISKYTGSLKARNFEIFRQRLEEKGLGHLAQAYFKCSGALAVACYKEELEAALRTRRLAGFQLLDLQDFSGQGTALVGILDAFMDSKGLVTPEEWRTFCSDAVLLARFHKYNYVSGENFQASIELVRFESKPMSRIELQWSLADDTVILASGTAHAAVQQEAEGNYIDICRLNLVMPKVSQMTKAVFTLQIQDTDIRKSYELWIYPAAAEVEIRKDEACWLEVLDEETLKQLEQGARMILMPRPDSMTHAIEGAYCQDFWCYPMFRSISESMNRKIPVGTMGLLIHNSHPVFQHFPSEEHSTYSWWSIVSHSCSLIMDDTPPEWSPIVQTIDNFERNHKLGLLLECRVGMGRLLICPLDREVVQATPEGRQFLYSLASYVNSEEFQPTYEAGIDELLRLVR
jgi:hypothetical protein